MRIWTYTNADEKQHKNRQKRMKNGYCVSSPLLIFVNISLNVKNQVSLFKLSFMYAGLRAASLACIEIKFMNIPSEYSKESSSTSVSNIRLLNYCFYWNYSKIIKISLPPGNVYSYSTSKTMNMRSYNSNKLKPFYMKQGLSQTTSS